MNRIKNKAGGRPLKLDPATYRITVNFSSVEHNNFLTLYEQSGMPSKAAFVKARVFNESFRVVKVDSEAIKFCFKLSSLHNQFRAIGRNYNQVVVALKRNFNEQMAMKLLYQLEQKTMELAVISQQIVRLTEELKTGYGSED